MAVDPDDWKRLWAGVREISGLFPDGVVFIGGIAVLLHVQSKKLPERFVELSHDGDFYVSLADFADLRDLEEVTANRRLNKHQIIKDGMEYDVYLENHNALSVRFNDVMQSSEVVDGVRIASLEHLLLLKLDAYRSRRGSAKGAKDERDLVKICFLLAETGLHLGRLTPYLTPENLESLALLRKSGEFLVICGGNAHEARELRESVLEVVSRIERAVEKKR